MNYPKEINAIIEKAHADKKQTARWSEGRKSGGTKNMEIDFKKEVEYEVGNWQKQRRVARNTGSKYWEPDSRLIKNSYPIDQESLNQGGSFETTQLNLTRATYVWFKPHSI